MNRLQENLVKILASLFVGYSKIAPGTLGTLVGIPIYLTLYFQGTKTYIIFATLFFTIGIGISSLAETILNEHDSPKIIIDEVAGFLITMLFIPPGVKFIVLGFILFRIMDIWKPAPISCLQKLPRGLGIMADDIMAGIYSNIILQVLVFYIF